MKYTEKDLVDFGNQLLSKDRKVINKNNKHLVNDADLSRFKEGREQWTHPAESIIKTALESLRIAVESLKENRKQYEIEYIKHKDKL